MTPSQPPTEEPRAGLGCADAAYAAVFAALAVWSWVGIGLAEAGTFRAPWLLVLAVPASLASAVAAWRSLSAGARDRASSIGVVGLLAVAAIALPSQLVATLANPVVALRNALPFALLQHVGLVPYYVGATLAGPDAQRMLQAAGFRVRETTAVMHCPRALAVAVFGIMRRFGNPSMQRRLQSWLMWFERFERSAMLQRIGYFVALVADKGMA